MSFANGIKRIRDKTFCFDIWLKPNLHTWHTTRIHRARYNSAELRGIRMSEFPPLLLRKWAMIGSLSQNLFCQLQAKSKWLTILESLKKKNKHGQRPQPLIKQTRCSYELKRIHICGVHLGLLSWTSLGGLCLWIILVFPIIISASGWLWSLSLSLPLLLCLHIQFPRDMCTNFGLYKVFTCIFNSRRISAQVLYSSFLIDMGFVPTYSILGGYMHKFLLFLTHEEVLGVWPTWENNFANGCVGGDSDLRGSL